MVVYLYKSNIKKSVSSVLLFYFDLFEGFSLYTGPGLPHLAALFPQPVSVRGERVN